MPTGKDAIRSIIESHKEIRVVGHQNIPFVHESNFDKLSDDLFKLFNDTIMIVKYEYEKGEDDAKSDINRQTSKRSGKNTRRVEFKPSFLL